MDTSMPTDSIHEDMPEKDLSSAFEGEMVVWELLLPGWQASALEKAARSRGLTVGQLVRGMIRDYFHRFAATGSNLTRAV